MAFIEMDFASGGSIDPNVYLLKDGKTQLIPIDFPTTSSSSYGYSSTHSVGVSSVNANTDSFDITTPNTSSWVRWGIGTSYVINLNAQRYSKLVLETTNLGKTEVDISTKQGTYYVGIYGYVNAGQCKAFFGIGNAKTYAQSTDVLVSDALSFGSGAVTIQVKNIYLVP